MYYISRYAIIFEQEVAKISTQTFLKRNLFRFRLTIFVSMLSYIISSGRKTGYKFFYHNSL